MTTNKQALRELIADARERRFDKLVITVDELESIVDVLESAERRNAVLTESLKEMVQANKSTIRTGYERIIDLGGDCDSPEVMISGNCDIMRAEKILAAATDKGE